MFFRGQKVIYSRNGVCEIKDIIVREDGVQVYVMQPASGLVSYVPVDSTVFMRELITKEEAERVIAAFPSVKTSVFESTNSKALADQYRMVLNRHDLLEVLGLYKTLRQKIENAQNAGKRRGTMDERFAGTALDSVTEELAVVLEVSKEEILEKLGI